MHGLCTLAFVLRALFEHIGILGDRIVRTWYIRRAAGATSMDIEESEGEDDGPYALVDGLRLPLKPDTASGFVGVQRSASKNCLC